MLELAVGLLVIGTIYLMDPGRLRQLGAGLRSFGEYIKAQQEEARPQAEFGGQPPQWGAVYHYNQGNVQSRRGRLEEAVEEYSLAIEADPTYANAFYNRGATYRRLNRKEEAIADFQRYLALSDDPEGVAGAKRHLEELQQ